MYCVYTHIRLDNKQIFYVGIGNHKRAYDKSSRNNHWKHIVNKCGYSVSIVVDDLSWQEACSWEKYLIGLYGRRDKNTGSLVNMTDGGEGTVGSPRPLLAEYSRSNPKYGKENPMYGVTGELHPCYGLKRDDTAQRNRLKKGLPLHENTIKGLLKKISKPVIDSSTGVIYGSAKEAAHKLNINYNTLKAKLSGRNTNNTTLIYYN